MKKVLAVVGLMAALSPVFGQVVEEYTLYYRGDITGFVTIQKDKGGKITITPQVSGRYVANGFSIDRAICPLIPAQKVFYLAGNETSIIIDGNTTMETNAFGSWFKTVVAGNTTTATWKDGGWSKTVVTGNTTMVTTSGGLWSKRVVEGNTTMGTSSDGSWYKTVVTGNTTMVSTSSGWWSKTVVTGNTTMYTNSWDLWHKTVVDKQGNNVFITETFNGPWER